MVRSIRTTFSCSTRRVSLVVAGAVVALVLSANSLRASDAVIDVCSTCTYKKIGDAIQGAPEGALISIGPGVYKESGLIINKALQLIGSKDHQTVVDAEGAGQPLTVTAPNVSVRGIKWINSGHASTRDIAAIRVENTSGCILDDNQILNSTYGIYLAKTEGCSILRNVLRTDRKDSDQSGSGIHVWSGKNITIVGNEVSGHRDGIYFEFVKESQISDNYSHGNLRYGLHFMFSNFNKYENNRFDSNESGVAVMYSHGIQMTANRFEKSRGGASYGLLLKDISDSTIRGNLFSDNTTGIYLEGTTRTQIYENDFISNGWAIRLISSSEQNQFKDNNFLSNTFEVSALPGSTRNIFEHNYWSHYDGLDLNHDGLGDIPYHPVRLSAVWMQTVDGASLLMNSFFMTLADQAENLMPSLTPDHVVDPHPLARRRQ